MWKTALLLCVVCLTAAPLHAPAAEPPASAEPVTVDGTLARQCLKLAGTKDESARDSAVLQRLRGLEHEEFARLAALVREELGGEAAKAAAVPPKGDLRSAWLLNYLDAKAEALAFDLAEDGSFVRWVAPGRIYIFRTFGKRELTVHINESTLHYKELKRSLEAYSRVYLRRIPGSSGYYAAAWQGLTKHRGSPPAPNPEGRHIPRLMRPGLLDERVVSP